MKLFISFYLLFIFFQFLICAHAFKSSIYENAIKVSQIDCLPTKFNHVLLIRFVQIFKIILFQITPSLGRFWWEWNNASWYQSFQGLCHGFVYGPQGHKGIIFIRHNFIGLYILLTKILSKEAISRRGRFVLFYFLNLNSCWKIISICQRI